jgi:hypothetical protein
MIDTESSLAHTFSGIGVVVDNPNAKERVSRSSVGQKVFAAAITIGTATYVVLTITGIIPRMVKVLIGPEATLVPAPV